MKNYKEVEELLLETVGQANDYYIQKRISAHEELTVIRMYYQKERTTESLIN